MKAAPCASDAHLRLGAGTTVVFGRVDEMSLDGIERILVVVAHPDDVDFAAAGSIATWTDAGVEVSYCIVTDGDAGGFDPAVPRAEIPDIRRAEQTAAAKVVGVTDLTFLGYSDGRLESTIELRRDVSRVIRQVRPQRVLCPSPERNFGRVFASHPDHLAAGEATLCAVYPDARNPFAHPELLAEGFEPWSVDEVWIMAAPNADVFVDTTDVFHRKLDALHCHSSQMPDPDSLEPRLRDWGTMVAALAGFPEGRLAEGFFAVNTAG
jgi:LmbE family N-acetylglucosaminyl deacetylase